MVEQIDTPGVGRRRRGQVQADVVDVDFGRPGGEVVAVEFHDTLWCQIAGVEVAVAAPDLAAFDDADGRRLKSAN